MQGIGQLLWKLREKEGIRQKQLCLGISSVSKYARIEADQQEIDFFLIDRIMGRLGNRWRGSLIYCQGTFTISMNCVRRYNRKFVKKNGKKQNNVCLNMRRIKEQRSRCISSSLSRNMRRLHGFVVNQ